MKPITKILFAFMFMFWTYYSCAELEKQTPLSMRDELLEKDDLENIDDLDMPEADLPEADLPEVDLPEGDPYTIAVGLYGEKKYLEAIPWFEKASEEGNLDASYYLGIMHYSGLGTIRDITKSYDWHKVGADKGHSSSQYALGRMYYYGETEIPQDLTKAFEWYQKSADQGNPNAQYYIGRKYYYGENGQAIDIAQSIGWFQKSADQGSADAQYHMGEIYYHAEGGEAQDYDKAYDWYAKAAEQGHGNAIRVAGYFHFSGLGSRNPSNVKAFEYWSDPTPYSFPAKRNLLGGHLANLTADCYLQVIDCGADLDVDEGLKHLKLAATTYWIEVSILQLGDIYETGKPNAGADPIPSIQSINDALNLYHNCKQQLPNSLTCPARFTRLMNS